MEEKKPRDWFIRTKDGYTYRIIADFVEYDEEDRIVYFKKRLDNQPGPKHEDIFVVALFPFDEVKFCGIDGFICVGKLITQ